MSQFAGYLERIRISIREADEKDYVIPIWLVLLPFILGVLGAIALLVSILGFMMTMLTATGPSAPPPGMATGAMVGVLALVSLLMFLGFISLIVQLYVIYKLIDRRNQHFSRTNMLYEDVANLLDSMGYKDSSAKIRATLRELNFEVGGEKGAVLWVVIYFLFSLIIFYILHFLNKDFRKHSKAEMDIYDELNKVFQAEGLPTVDPRSLATIPDRSTILYIILSILTLGIFLIYWLYTAAKDGNEHMEAHRRIEAQLLTNLEELVSRKSSG